MRAYLLIITVFLFCSAAEAQPSVSLRSGTIQLRPVNDVRSAEEFPAFAGNRYLFAELPGIPEPTDVESLAARGIRLLGYVGNRV